jgi:hypothetical protein
MFSGKIVLYAPLISGHAVLKAKPSFCLSYREI